jgi:hypothetical protein
MAGNDFFIEGKLLKKYDTQQVTATFSKRELVLEVPGTYVQYVKFELKQAKCGELDAFNEGEQIKVHFNIDGREWQGKYFTNLSAWRIERVGAAQGGGQSNGGYPDDYNPSQNQTHTTSTPVSTTLPAQNDADDLPF